MTTSHMSTTLTYPRLTALIVCRLVLNTIFRVAYPLVPFVVLHFGVSTQAATWIVTVQVLAGLASPLGGWLGDRNGYRATMLLAMCVVAVGTLLVAFSTALPAVIAGLGLAGFGTTLYLPSVQAYISAHTPYARRGRALGLVEFSWSLAGILLVAPMVALAEWSGGLQLPFALLTACIAGCLVITRVFLPPDQPRERLVASSPRSLQTVLRQPAVIALFCFLWLAVCGQEILFIVQAPWLTEHFGATPQEIGNTLLVFGIGELIGVTLATALTDRLGKLRAPLLGFTGAAMIYFLLPLLAQSWASYLILFMLFALCFEFAIVSSFSLASGIDPAARGIVMAGTTFSTQTGRGAGAWIGVPLLEATNIVVNGIVASVLTLIGVGIAAIWVRPQEKDRDIAASEAVTIL